MSLVLRGSATRATATAFGLVVSVAALLNDAAFMALYLCRAINSLQRQRGRAAQKQLVTATDDVLHRHGHALCITPCALPQPPGL